MPSNFPEIRTPNYLLRQFSDADLENVYRGLSNEAVIKHYGISYKNLEATKGQMTWFADLEVNGTGLWWAICSLDNSTFYGGGGFSDLNAKLKKAEIGIWLYPEYWGRNIMSEVLPFICAHGFNVNGLHRIEGFVETENTACIAAMNKLGFVNEGIMRECEIKGEIFISLQIFSKLKTD